MTFKQFSEQVLTQLPPPPAHIQSVGISQSDRNLLATVLVLEAGGESPEGMQAVLNVISNRARNNPSKLIAVITKPYQFSALNAATVSHQRSLDDLIAKAQKHPRWKLALDLVDQATKGTLKDITGGAKYYHTLNIHPSWEKNLRQTAQIGHHIFFSE